MSFFNVLRQALNQVPQGHSELLMGASCGQAGSAPWQIATYWGVCGEPLGENVVMTLAPSGNTLGLALGDQIVAVSRFPGAKLLDTIAAQAMCGSAMPSAGAITSNAANSLFSVVQPGDTLTVQSSTGVMRTVMVPARGTMTWCSSPWGYQDFEIQTTIRPDNVVVFRIPEFLSSANPLPDPLTDSAYEQWVAAYVGRIKTELDKAVAANAVGVIWDARSNTGGSQDVAIAIAAGMPGATSMKIEDCYARVPGSNPPSFATTPDNSYSLTAGGTLVYAGKVAVLIDSQTYSAGDIFAYAVHNATSAKIFGAPSSGAFGFDDTDAEFMNADVAPIDYIVNNQNCVDASGVPLEGRSVMPDVIVNYDPKDLAMGVDTILEAAATYLKQ
jgi:Peptidase family S41